MKKCFFHYCIFKNSPYLCTAFERNFPIRTGCSAVRLAHLLWEQGVVGSNPATPTSLRNWQLQFFRLFHLRFPYPFYRHTLGNE